MSRKPKPQPKTNAMRELENAGIPYVVHAYETPHGEPLPGVDCAAHLGVPVETVYKTLVARGSSGNLHVFVIPAAEELDLKKAASSAGEKAMAMISPKELPQHTGYVRGGCSPVGMKKPYPTVIEESAQLLDTFLVSGGKIGVSVEVNPDALCGFLDAKYADVIMG